MAREAELAGAALKAGALPPQRPEFQGSPLKVFGQHDEATIAQMRNCMSVGNDRHRETPWRNAK